MTMDIRETFLDYAEHGELYFFGKPIKTLRDVKLRYDLAAFRESFDVAVERRGETCLIQQRGMHQVGNGANLLRCLFYDRSVFMDAFCRLRT
jgi:hypothetical protein